MSMLKLNVEVTIAEERLIARLRQVFANGYKNQLIDLKAVKHGKAFMSGTVCISKSDATKQVAITASLCKTWAGYALSLSKDSAKQSNQASRAIKTVYLNSEQYKRLDAYLCSMLTSLCEAHKIPIITMPQKNTTTTTVASTVETPAVITALAPIDNRVFSLCVCKSRNSVKLVEEKIPQYHKEVAAFVGFNQSIGYLNNLNKLYETAKTKVNFAAFVDQFIKDEKASA
jgi:hypothetical protein